MTIDDGNREGTVIVYNAAAAQQIILRGNRKRFGIFPEIANQQAIGIQPVPCAVIRIIPAQQSPFVQTVLQITGIRNIYKGPECHRIHAGINCCQRHLTDLQRRVGFLSVIEGITHVHLYAINIVLSLLECLRQTKLAQNKTTLVRL